MSDDHPSARPDPLIDEIRAIRQKLFDKCSRDMDKFAARSREVEQQHAHRDRTPERPAPSDIQP